MSKNLLRCFFAKPEGTELIVKLEERARSIAQEFDIELHSVFPQDGTDLRDIRSILQAEIDTCAMILVEASGFS